MEKIKVGVTIIYQPNHYIMHQRKPGNDIGEEDSIGLYGGQFETEQDETLADTARRKIAEESGLMFAAGDLSSRGIISTISERKGKKIKIEAEIFWINLPINFKNGEFKDSIPMTRAELIEAKRLGKLSTVATAALTEVIEI